MTMDTQTETPMHDRQQEVSLYVGNLPWSTRWQELKDLFKQAGNVLYADIPRMHDNKSRGFGIVRFGSAEEAQSAIEMFNEYDYNGRALIVREDQKGGRGGRSDTSGNGYTGEKHQVFVGNLPWSANWQDLKDLAKENNLNPVRADVAFGYDGRSRGWGTLMFASAEEANAAIDALNGIEMNGRNIECREDRKSKEY